MSGAGVVDHARRTGRREVRDDTVTMYRKLDIGKDATIGHSHHHAAATHQQLAIWWSSSANQVGLTVEDVPRRASRFPLSEPMQTGPPVACTHTPFRQH